MLNVGYTIFYRQRVKAGREQEIQNSRQTTRNRLYQYSRKFLANSDYVAFKVFSILDPQGPGKLRLGPTLLFPISDPFLLSLTIYL